jgi:pimeloyl-ACP methyl ester carboxylesterase
MRSLMRVAALYVMPLICGCVTAPPTEPRRIEQAGYRSVGDMEQWVTIRGDDASKPLLLLVHGGPGDVQSPFVSTYAAYERDFVLVQWDQRGAGRTFQRYGKDTPGLSLERVVADGIELAEQLHKQFPGNRLILLGHSWGSIVATGMVQKRPDLFSAYVGTGQVASWAAVVNHQFDFLLAAARTNGDAATVAALEAIGRPDPLNVGQYFGTVSRTLRANQPAPDKAWLASIPMQLKEQGATDDQVKANGAGTTFSATALIGSLTHADLQASALVFAVPYCVIQGKSDLNAPTAAAKAYFDRVTAPEKRFAVIESAGHFAVATHQPEFMADIRKCLGPR